MPNSSAQIDRIADIPRLWARSAPDSPALWEGGVVVTFRTLQHLIDRAAVLLLERGVVAGDRVAIVAENSVAEVAMFFAASRLGAWPVIVNARLSSREVETTCAHCQPRVCAVKRRRFPVGVNPTRQMLQPEVVGAVMEVTKWLKPSM